MGDDELAAALRALIEAMIAARDKQTVGEMVEHYEDDLLACVGEDDVVLFGPEGQVDCVWKVPEPLPELLRRPIPDSLRKMLREGPDAPVTASFRTADYRRIGDRTYERIDA